MDRIHSDEDSRVIDSIWWVNRNMHSVSFTRDNVRANIAVNILFKNGNYLYSTAPLHLNQSPELLR